MSDQGERYEKSWILYHILDRYIGNREIVDVRRKTTIVNDQLETEAEQCSTGSRAEGFNFIWSDSDVMLIINNVEVLCPEKDISDQVNTTNKSVLMMRKANSRPGYVNLEVLHLEERCSPYFRQSIVAVGDAQFTSSDMYRRAANDILINMLQPITEIHGPAVQVKSEHYAGLLEIDLVMAFPCYNWPSEANEWVSRPRLHDWPDRALQQQIIQGGCHLVPVGDKMSDDQFLQWRISFATAERKLIHSLSHVQFLVYGLLKIFIKQISSMLDQILDEDVLSSYIIKTVIFHAVENTPGSFWQEKHVFLCFMVCLKILINWVNAGYCPNYFIKKNNMFLGKVHCQNRQKLLHFLTDLYDMNWRCLSVGTAKHLSIGECIRDMRNGAWEYVLPPPTYSESKRDLELFASTFPSTRYPDDLPFSLELLLGSKSDLDEFFGYFATVHTLSSIGMKIFGEHVTAVGNKEKYKSLRKCKNLLGPFSVVCLSPGLLRLATFYYQTGNYTKTLEICDHVISSATVYLDGTFSKGKPFDLNGYARLYCGRGYNLLQKCHAFVSDTKFGKNVLQFCPFQLHQDIMLLIGKQHTVDIPPLAYAVFLSFLCYHELGDTRRRDRTLISLRAVKYDMDQGGSRNFMVHNILGICYEMVGDKHRALREYRNSLSVRSHDQYKNSAKERIERLQHSR